MYLILTYDMWTIKKEIMTFFYYMVIYGIIDFHR